MTIINNIIKPDGPVKLTTSGSVVTEEIIDALDRMLKNPEFKPGMDILWDFREVKSINSPADGIREIVSFIKANQEKRGKNYRVALVVTRDIEFGLARMYEAYTQELPFDIRIFKDLQNAEQWLKPAE